MQKTTQPFLERAELVCPKKLQYQPFLITHKYSEVTKALFPTLMGFEVAQKARVCHIQTSHICPYYGGTHLILGTKFTWSQSSQFPYDLSNVEAHSTCASTTSSDALSTTTCIPYLIRALLNELTPDNDLLAELVGPL